MEKKKSPKRFHTGTLCIIKLGMILRHVDSSSKHIFLLGFRVALQFVHEMQNKSQKNFDASRDRSLPVFGVGVAFIDESSIVPVPSHEIDKAIQEIRLIVSNLAPPRKELHVVPIENICSSNSSDGRDRLKSLLDVVSDATGKEDLLLHLRMLSLQKVHF
jgi:cytoplasmic tRNA 2-thiolation protein 2